MFSFDLPRLFGVGLHILAAIFFAIHAVRRGRELYWLLILFMFPLFGSVVYFFAIYLYFPSCPFLIVGLAQQ
mgnify:CR=1 FL=1